MSRYCLEKSWEVRSHLLLPRLDIAKDVAVLSFFITLAVLVIWGFARLRPLFGFKLLMLS